MEVKVREVIWKQTIRQVLSLCIFLSQNGERWSSIMHIDQSSQFFRCFFIIIVCIGLRFSKVYFRTHCGQLLEFLYKTAAGTSA